MNGRKAQIGVVGAGSFADLWYLPILEKHPEVQIQAICSQSGTTAEKLANKYNILANYQSYQEMFEKEELDGICIVTPNESHHDIALEASKRGIHVMCEKPLAMDRDEARLMVEAAEENGIVHGVNFTYREHPAVKKLKELLEEDFIGRIYDGKFQYTGAYGLSGPPGWRGTKSKGGTGGVLADLGSHLIDLVQFVVNENVSKVQASLSFLHEGKVKTIHEMDNHDQSADSVYFNASFPSGAHGSFYTSWISSQGNRRQTIELSFFGSKGAVKFLSSELGVVLTYAHGKEQWQELHLENVMKWDDLAQPSEERFRPWRLTERNEIWKWADLLVESKNSGRASSTGIPTFRDGYSVQKVIDAVIQSADLRKEVSVER
ncbi:Gfo/Idh/MocA family protein [Halalkalibacter kiskunsagensis]|uniref:Gfo/Idh/MocA family protein n=1 Tax=Halalkalibacter kiskunsagensis TaxID=1548599 RepID=A0ABV6KBE9_9BACI